LLASLLLAATSAPAGGFLQIRDGYFWDPAAGDYFIPRGMAYQTWNPPVGADQSFEQLDYDLTEFKKMHANSVRCEMVWNEVERSPGVFDWSKPDHLVAAAEALGLRLFVLIGFQYAPGWFPEEWKAVNDHGERSVVLNYEHPEARRVYSNYIHQVTSRYRNRAVVGGWILGNEYAYFDLWNPDHRYLGFDPISQDAFRQYLADRYGGSIAALNAVWGTAYTSFSQVGMPLQYPPNRHNPAYQDLTLWREHSIGGYVAVGAVAAKQADPNHLRTYSMVGGLFIGHDANYTCEDARTIVARCAAAGAPLDFWAINNYAWATLVAELRSGDFGISKHLAFAGLPVLVSETGHSTTDDLLPGADARQAEALPGQMWEALMSGAMGTHIFTWNDRDLFGGIFIREKGFGIVQQSRLPKTPVYSNVVELFRRMEDLKVERLFGGSSNPPPDVQFFWSRAAEMGWPRANQENAMIWGALQRLGYQPWVIDDEPFERGDYTHAPALVLSRCYQMAPEHLDRLATNAVARGLHLFANADLPGQYDAYHRANPNWAARMSALFGLNVAAAVPDWDSGVSDTVYHRVYLSGATALDPLPAVFSDNVLSWKIWKGISASSGVTIARHTGDQGSEPALPALHIKDLGAARSAITTFALGDLQSQDSQPPAHDWDVRYNWLRAVFRTHFGLQPKIDLTGPNTSYVIPDYRLCRNGTVLISLLNGITNNATVTLTAHALLDGKTVEDLTGGGILEVNSDGVVPLSLTRDQYVLLYAYPRAGGGDASLVNTNASKLWFQAAPAAVWPTGPGCEVTLGHDVASNANLVVAFERVALPPRVYAQANSTNVAGQGRQTLRLQIPDADLNDIGYLSTPEGGDYVFHAWLERGGQRLAEASLPVRLLWGVRPLALPVSVTAGSSYQVPVKWEELPSYEPSEMGLPLDRAAFWEQWKAGFQHYDVVLELRRTNGAVVWCDHFLTSQGTGQHTFTANVPPGATGPFTWFAYLRAATNASVDLFDGFENRGPGADAGWLSPWTSYVYSHYNTARYLDGGVQPGGSGSAQSGFLVVTNPANRGDYSGFGLIYSYGREWSLPTELALWTNYAFSFDFKEAAGLACVLEMQVKDALGGQIEFTKTYTPGPGGWDTLRASLDQFVVTPWIGFFNLARVNTLVVNVRMDSTNATFVASFDNIHFDGPDVAPPAPASQDFADSFEDRGRGDNPALIQPWGSYVYSQSNNAAFLAQGVHTEAYDGFQSAFMVVSNAPRPGAYAGFGMYYVFPAAWALPAQTNLWTNYWFSYAFKEQSGLPCQVEMQIKSGQQNWREYVKTYTPGPNGWDLVQANLNQFVRPSGAGAFDPAQFQSIAINVRMLRTNALYIGSFDRVRLDAPDTPLAADLRFGIYASDNDSLRDTDRDGIPDAYETGTGIYVSPTNTGTSPTNPDSDGDGLTDGQELEAGTNPNIAAEVLRLVAIQRLSGTDVALAWPARTNRVYAVYHLDAELAPEVAFVPLPGFTRLVTPTNGLMRVVDPSATPAQRFYRVLVHRP
jgi:hypothetical protein